MEAEKFLNLTKYKAQDLAEANNMIFRLIRSDGELFFDYPDDAEKRTDRICIELEAGRVVKAIVS